MQEQPAPTIDDFIDHRWHDAKEVLRELDPEYVNKLESLVRLKGIGLEYPFPVDPSLQPTRRLPKKWHWLLESCTELVELKVRLQIAASGLTAKANQELQPLEAGKRFDYHISSHAVQCFSFAERAKNLIRQTIGLYVTDPNAGKEMSEKYDHKLRVEVVEHIEALRNQFAHGGTRPMAKGITEDQLWEGSVATGTTPRKFLIEDFYPRQGDKVLRGAYESSIDRTTKEVTGRVSVLLRELENELQEYQMHKF